MKFFKSFSKRKDACPNFKFLLGFQFGFRDAGAGEAAISAAALVLPFDEESQQAAAAYVGLEEHAHAAGAETDLLLVKAAVEVNALHAASNSDGLGNVSGLHTIVLGDNGASGAWSTAATDLHAAPNSDGMGDVFGLHTIVLGDNGASGVAATELPVAPITDGLGDFSELHGETNLSDAFWLLDFGGHGGAASVRGDTGSIAFSIFGDVVIRDSLVISLLHPIHACAHSRLDGCGEGSWVCVGDIACVPLSSFFFAFFW